MGNGTDIMSPKLVARIIWYVGTQITETLAGRTANDYIGRREDFDFIYIFVGTVLPEICFIGRSSIFVDFNSKDRDKAVLHETKSETARARE